MLQLYRIMDENHLKSPSFQDDVDNVKRKFPRLIGAIQNLPLGAESLDMFYLTLHGLPPDISEDELQYAAAVNFHRLEVWLEESYFIPPGRTRSFIAIALRSIVLAQLTEENLQFFNRMKALYFSLIETQIKDVVESTVKRVVKEIKDKRIMRMNKVAFPIAANSTSSNLSTISIESEEKCCLCLRALRGTQFYLPCTHRMHMACAQRLIEENIRKCPMCRVEFSIPSSVVRVTPRSTTVQNIIETADINPAEDSSTVVGFLTNHTDSNPRESDSSNNFSEPHSRDLTIASFNSSELK